MLLKKILRLTLRFYLFGCIAGIIEMLCRLSVQVDIIDLGWVPLYYSIFTVLAGLIITFLLIIFHNIRVPNKLIYTVLIWFLISIFAYSIFKNNVFFVKKVLLNMQLRYYFLFFQIIFISILFEFYGLVKKININIKLRYFVVPLIVIQIVFFRLPAIRNQYFKSKPVTITNTYNLKSSKPDIFLILADTVRYDYIDDLLKKKELPVLEKIAGDAKYYTNFYSVSSWTKPVVASLLSSKMPSVLNMIFDSDNMEKKHRMLQEILRESGYYTVGITPNHLINGKYGFNRGFDEYYNFLSTPLRKFVIIKIMLQLKLYPPLKFYHTADEIIDIASSRLKKIKKFTGAPVFMFIHVIDPHSPYYLKYKDGRNKFISSYKMSTRSVKKGIEYYKSEIIYTDSMIGRFIAMLKKENLYKKNMIIFTSDHGEEFYEHNFVDHGRTLHEEITHVPLIVKYPSNAYKGVNDKLFSTIDIAPEILKTVFRDETPGKRAGFTGITLSGKGRKYVWSEMDRFAYSRRSVRNKKYRIIKMRRWGQVLITYKLFKSYKDIYEKDDIFKEGVYSKTKKEFQQVLFNFEKKFNVKNKYSNEEITNRIKSLNYLY